MDTLLPQLLAFPPHPPPEAPLSDAEYTKQIRFVIDVLGSTPANQLTGAAKGSGNLLDVSQARENLVNAANLLDLGSISQFFAVPIYLTCAHQQHDRETKKQFCFRKVCARHAIMVEDGGFHALFRLGADQILRSRAATTHRPYNSRGAKGKYGGLFPNRRTKIDADECENSPKRLSFLFRRQFCVSTLLAPR